MTNTEEKVTLTQRRRTSGVEKLDKAKLQNIGDLEDESSGSAKRVVVWIIIIIALAAAAVLAIRSFMNYRSNDDTQNNDDTVIEEVTPTPDPKDSIVSEIVLPDSEAENAPTDESFSLNEQTISESSEDVFTINDLFIQPYESFIRVEYNVTSNGDNLFPLTTAVYDADLQQIAITLEGVEDESALGFGQTVVVQDSVVEFVTHEIVSGDNETYVIKLNQESGFVLNTIEDAIEGTVILDIKEVEVIVTPEEEIVDVTGEVEPTTEEVTTPPTGNNLTNDFTTSGTQYIKTNSTGNTVGLDKYNFINQGGLFTYRLFLSNGYPNATASLDGNVLTLEVENVSYDGIVGNGGKGQTDFAARGVEVVSKADITNSGGKSTFKFDLTKSDISYRVFVEEDTDRLVLEIKH